MGVDEVHPAVETSQNVSPGPASGSGMSKLRDPAEPSVCVWFTVEGPAQNHVGALHGDVVYALVDHSVLLARIPHLNDGERVVTHDPSVSLLRPVAGGQRVDLTGTVLRRGRAVAFIRAELTVDGQVVASAQITKSVVAQRGGWARDQEARMAR